MGKSVERDGVFGRYTEHYDDAGNKIGESREVDGVFGRHVEHTDVNGNKIGESRDVSGFFGEYTEHRDAGGDKLGESRRRDGLFGEYTEHVDDEGNSVGESRERQGVFGDYTENTGTTWRAAGGRAAYRAASYSYSGGGGGGEANWILWLVGLLFGLTLLVLALVVAVPVALIGLGIYLIVKKSNPWARAGGACLIVFTLGAGLLLGINYVRDSRARTAAAEERAAEQRSVRVVSTESHSLDPGSTAAKLGLAGSWSGSQNNRSTSIVIDGGSGDDFYGTKTQANFQIAFSGHINPSTREVRIQETRILSGASSWSLGSETGRLSADGRTISGTGKDVYTRYSWSYSKR
jgi:hypothetical protein